MSLPLVTATRFVAPLREGGSLPGIVEADDLGTYVCKFRGAGQGLGVLVAEVIVSGLAELIGLRTPRLVEVELTEPIARYEADEEVQDLLNASLGRNLGVDFLPGSFGFDASVEFPEDLGARVLWLDAFTANVDRSWRNPNLLVWHGEVWAIDHGAALYFRHGWSSAVTDPQRFAEQPWSIEDHVMSGYVDRLAGVADELADLVTDDALEEIIDRVPDEWLVGPVPPTELRAAYRAFLRARLDGSRVWLPDGTCCMTTRLAYQYVILRCVPRVDREEFLNVGVVAYCQEAGFLAAACHVDEARMQSFAPELDPGAVTSALAFVDAVCRGDSAVGAAATGDLGTRFGFLKAPRSTVVQPGPVHGGTTTDPAAEVARLLDLLVR